MSERACFDCRYGLLEAKNAGDKVGSDIGFDSEGNVTTDPGEILNGGAIRNFTRLVLSLYETCTQNMPASRITGHMILIKDQDVFEKDFGQEENLALINSQDGLQL